MNTYGEIKLYTEDEEFICDIISLQNVDKLGEYIPASWGNPPVYPLLTYDCGIVECYDLNKDDKVESAEIIYLDYKFTEFECDVEIVKQYYDHNNNCLVIEFKPCGRED